MYVGCCESVCSYRTGVWVRMIVETRGDLERWSCMFRGVVEDINRALLMFPTKFSDKVKSSCPIEGPLDLKYEIW